MGHIIDYSQHMLSFLHIFSRKIFGGINERKIFYSRASLAKLLNISLSTLDRLCARNEPPFNMRLKIGTRRVLFPQIIVEALLTNSLSKVEVQNVQI